MADQQCGEIVTIGGTNAYTAYSADLLEFTPVSGIIDYDVARLVGNNEFFVNRYEYQPSNLTIKFVVYGSTYDNCYRNVSKLVAACKNAIIKPARSSFEYVCVLISFNTLETGIDNYVIVELKLLCVKRLQILSYFSASTSLSFTNEGDVPSGMKIEITPSRNLSTVNVGTYRIKNLTANTKVTIDGIQGKVTQGSQGVNKFLDVENLISFPKANPGSNSITFSSYLSLAVTFYPTFII